MIQLPTVPRGTTLKPKLIRYGGDLTSSLGGPTQRIVRLGSRYAVEVGLPSLDAVCGAEWVSCALQAEALGDTLGLAMPQTVPYVGNPNNVKGTGTAGTPNVSITGGAPPVGCWISFVANGRHYLHLMTSVQGSTCTVSPILRASISALKLEVVAPVLEGFPDDLTQWDVEWFRFIGHSFTLTENA
jgi:hypothetical protein